MDRFLVQTKQEWLRIVCGSSFNAVKRVNKECNVKKIPKHVKDDDIWYGRVGFDDL